MVFRFYSNAVSQASKGVAMAIFVVGLLLTGFGVLIFAFPRVFATLAAMVFFIMGFASIGTAARIWWTQRQIDRYEQQQNYRENVRVREFEDYRW